VCHFAAALTTAAAIALLGAAAAAAAPIIFQATGSEQTYTVPAGITAINVLVVGGSGAPAFPGVFSGGQGAFVIADVHVNAGETLFVEVGQDGGLCLFSPAAFNGGGCGNEGGGGASDIRTVSCGSPCNTTNPNSLASRLVTAGGGGGGGGGAGTAGGNAGILGNVGQTLDASSGGPDFGFEGGGALAAGSGGTGGGTTTMPLSNCPGSPGSEGQGGAGASTGGGGGGGGGLFGGGGGAASNGGCGSNGGGGGGGGTSGVASAAFNANSGLNGYGMPQIVIVTPVPVNGTPTIAGNTSTPTSGQTLTGSHGSWLSGPISSYSDQWLRCDAAGANCAPIPGATGLSYPLTAADIGSTIRLQETATNMYGSGSPASSTQTGVVGAPPNATAPPAISGVDEQGRVLSESHATWTSNPASFALQWRRCAAGGVNCVPIPGATGPTYTLTASDVGATIDVQETASNAYGTGSPATSAPTNPIQPPGTHTASIDGPTSAKIGVPNAYQVSVVDSDGTPNSFSWIVDGLAAGSASTLNVTFTSSGRHTIVVQVGDTAGNTLSNTLIVTATLRRLNVTVSWADRFSSQFTIFTSLLAHGVPIGTHIALTCVGGGCPFAHQRLTVSATRCGKKKKCASANQQNRDVDLTSLVARARLRVNTKLTVTFTLWFFIGQVQTFTIGPGPPSRRIACLAPGATRPSRVC
jgi:hypothetical protein